MISNRATGPPDTRHGTGGHGRARNATIIEFETSRPNAARMYDYYLGGKDHFAVDRAAADEILRIAPETRRLARDNRAFVGRAVRHLIDAGVRQFLDLGAGLPTRDNVHQVAHALASDACTVHVDSDPVVCAHARALFPTGDRSAVVEADLRRPEAVLGSPEVRRLLDFDRPVAVVLAAVLHFVTDDTEAAEIVTAYRSMIGPGGHLLVSHGTRGTISAQVKDAGEGIYARSSSPTRLRDPHEVLPFFGDLTMIEPGLVNVAEWHPAGPVPGDPQGAYMVGGLARRD